MLPSISLGNVCIYLWSFSLANVPFERPLLVRCVDVKRTLRSVHLPVRAETLAGLIVHGPGPQI